MATVMSKPVLHIASLLNGSVFPTEPGGAFIDIMFRLSLLCHCLSSFRRDLNSQQYLFQADCE